MAPGSPTPRPSSLAAFMRPSLMRDSAHVFAEAKIANANISIFSSDVLMEGELEKKGLGGLHTWKKRMFVLRGQELCYYALDSERYNYGAQKGSLNIRGAFVERHENCVFSVSLSSGVTRLLTAPNVQSLMDWMTAISVAASASVVEPPSDMSMVDHSRTTHIILVRHGQYHLSQTSSEDLAGPLTSLGIEQSKVTGRFLKEYLDARMVFKRFPKLPIYHSGVKRSVETAQFIAHGFDNPNCYEMRENKLFREAWPCNPLPSTNRKTIPRENLDNMVSDCARVKLVYRTMFRHLIADDLSVPEQALSPEDQEEFARIFGGRTQHRVGDRYRIVVCHANIIRWFICRAMGIDPDGSWGRMRYNNCGITALEIDSVGNVQLSFMNQIGHMGTTMITEN
ncbi:hypothetical protein Poli38472_014710 [Pythium oligandrum]|uniref:Serine/threonine-protein phosphatase PGAM5, mitochondrial n=1 Tax=Pythium oligandrum TaxID=41045 RepID=A0A8K1FHK8_PYTOL|nr:hypothetical protein Poli38472_014710 [Pythium oligandrum]|eukprot:TMW64005.1 hypothetical protein Poli38472_014710 [Pythium oligandrum]